MNKITQLKNDKAIKFIKHKCESYGLKWKFWEWDGREHTTFIVFDTIPGFGDLKIVDIGIARVNDFLNDIIDDIDSYVKKKKNEQDN